MQQRGSEVAWARRRNRMPRGYLCPKARAWKANPMRRKISGEAKRRREAGPRCRLWSDPLDRI